MKKLPKYGYGFKIDTLNYDNKSESNSDINLPFLNNYSKPNIKVPLAQKANPNIRISLKNNKANPQDIANEFYKNGFNRTATLGILGNAFAESGFDTNAIGDKGTSKGLWQLHNERNKGLVLGDWLNQTQKTISQISPSLKRKLNNSKDLYESAYLFTKDFERPQNAHQEGIKRGKYANDISNYVNAYGGKLPKYGFGDYLKQNPDTASMGLGILGAGVDSLNNKVSPDLKLSTLSGALKGAGTGASIGSSIIPGVGTAIGGVVGGIVGGVSGLIKGNKEKERIATETANQNNRMNDYFASRSSQILANYPTKGITGQSSFLAKGGVVNPQYEVEKDEVVQGGGVELEEGNQIASDIHKVGGETHENGGTQGQGGERVFSDRIIAPNVLSSIMKSTGIPIKDKSTFADIATYLGKKKGVFEEKIESHDYVKQNTGKLMIGKIDQLLNLTFQTQEEMKKQDASIQQFKYGGNLPKLAYGNPPLKSAGNSIEFDQFGTPISKKSNWLNQTGGSAIYKNLNNNLLSYVNPLQSVMSAYPMSYDPIKGGGLSPINVKRQTLNRTEFDTNSKYLRNSLNPSTDKIPFTDAPKKDISSLMGYGMTVLGYLNDRNSINKMNTNVSKQLLDFPTLNYQDRSQIAKDNVSQSFRDLTNSRSKVNLQGAFAQKLKAFNEINNNENINRNNYENQFADKVFRTNAYNININNDAADTQRQLQNQKISYLSGANSNFLSNIQDVQREQNVKKYQNEQVALIRETNNLKTNGGANYQLDMLKRKKASGTITPYEQKLLEYLS